MASKLNEEKLEKKFQLVTNSQDSIQTLSLWILYHKTLHKKIVDIWLKTLKKSKVSHRLVLMYVANDVIQTCKKKSAPQYAETFAEALGEATMLVRDEKIRPMVERVFNVWDQRSVYSTEFIEELRTILANPKVQTVRQKFVAEYKPQKVMDKIRRIQKLELESATKQSAVSSSKLDCSSSEIIYQLKDRTHGQQIVQEFDEAVRCLQEYIEMLEKEVVERSQLIELLEKGEIFYSCQHGEVKVVANAYRTFSGRVKALKKKLDELMPDLYSPVPSPCPDAPSPTNSDDGPELSPVCQGKEVPQMPNDLNAYQTFTGQEKELKKKLVEMAPELDSPVLSPCPDAPSPSNSDEGPDLSPLPKTKEEGKANEKADVQCENELKEDKPIELKKHETIVKPMTTQIPVMPSPKPFEDIISSAAQPLYVLKSTPPMIAKQSPCAAKQSPCLAKQSPSAAKQSPCPAKQSPCPPGLEEIKEQASGMMTSWIGAFNTNNPTFTKTFTLDPRMSQNSSLDSRLSCLMENIPNLPTVFRSSAFESQTSSTGSTPIRMDNPSISPPAAAAATTQLVSYADNQSDDDEPGTPVNDENRRSETPVEDEDTRFSGCNSLPRVVSMVSSLTSEDLHQSLLKSLTHLQQLSAGNTNTPSTISHIQQLPNESYSTTHAISTHTSVTDNVFQSTSVSTLKTPPSVSHIQHFPTESYSNAHAISTHANTIDNIFQSTMKTIPSLGHIQQLPTESYSTTPTNVIDNIFQSTLKTTSSASHMQQLPTNSYSSTRSNVIDNIFQSALKTTSSISHIQPSPTESYSTTHTNILDNILQSTLKTTPTVSHSQQLPTVSYSTTQSNILDNIFQSTGISTLKTPPRVSHIQQMPAESYNNATHAVSKRAAMADNILQPSTMPTMKKDVLSNLPSVVSSFLKSTENSEMNKNNTCSSTFSSDMVLPLLATQQPKVTEDATSYAKTSSVSSPVSVKPFDEPDSTVDPYSYVSSDRDDRILFEAFKTDNNNIENPKAEFSGEEENLEPMDMDLEDSDEEENATHIEESVPVTSVVDVDLRVLPQAQGLSSSSILWPTNVHTDVTTTTADYSSISTKQHLAIPDSQPVESAPAVELKSTKEKYDSFKKDEITAGNFDQDMRQLNMDYSDSQKSDETKITTSQASSVDMSDKSYYAVDIDDRQLPSKTPEQPEEVPTDKSDTKATEKKEIDVEEWSDWNKDWTQDSEPWEQKKEPWEQNKLPPKQVEAPEQNQASFEQNVEDWEQNVESWEQNQGLVEQNNEPWKWQTFPPHASPRGRGQPSFNRGRFRGGFRPRFPRVPFRPPFNQRNHWNTNQNYRPRFPPPPPTHPPPPIHFNPRYPPPVPGIRSQFRPRY